MKGKYISALVGIGAAAMFALPGVASASTAGQAKPGIGPGECASMHVPWYDRGKKIWVRQGHGPHARCVLVTVHGQGHGNGHGHGHGNGHGNGHGHGHGGHHGHGPQE
jgi:hypothetical protein